MLNYAFFQRVLGNMLIDQYLSGKIFILMNVWDARSEKNVPVFLVPTRIGIASIYVNLMFNN